MGSGPPECMALPSCSRRRSGRYAAKNQYSRGFNFFPNSFCFFTSVGNNCLPAASAALVRRLAPAVDQESREIPALAAAGAAIEAVGAGQASARGRVDLRLGDRHQRLRRERPGQGVEPIDGAAHRQVRRARWRW